MKKIILLILCVISIAPITKAVQLNGTYTINPSLAASASNFQNIRSAVTYLTSTGVRADAGPANSGTVGVSGPVEFIISAGTFNEQVSIPAITGSSTTNTVVFRGASRASTILTFASTDANNRHTLRLNLASNVTFRDMTIRGTGTSHAWVVHILGLNSNNNKFKNCLIDITGPGITSGSTLYIAVVINNSATAATTGTRVDGTEIDSCLINSGYYGIVSAGATSNLHVGLRVTNTQILNSYLYGIYATFANGVTFHNNLIYPRVSYQYNSGIYLLNSICTSPNRHIITNNKISGFGQYGIYISGSSNLNGNKGLIANNMIGGGIKYEYSMCLYLASTSQWRIFHNTLNHDMPGQSSIYSAAYITGGSANSFINNLCIEKFASPSVALYASASSVFDTMNYNLFYRPDTTTGGLIYVGSVLNSGNFRGAAGQNINSIYGNPMFANDTAMLNTNACFQGTPISYINTDIFGNARSATNPIIGAHETPSLADNLAVLNIKNISAPITAGSTDVQVMVRNNGNNTISSFNLTYVYNNGTPVVNSWSGTLTACDTVTVTFSGTQQATLGAVNNFVIYSSSPNTNLDTDRTNDTLRTSYFLPLNGTYYIGGASPDFAKPSEAFDALQAAGMTGPVRFEVRPGTYIDQITYDKPVLGLNATNLVTFAGKHRDSCFIITNNASGGARHTLKIGNSHIRVDSLTFRANSPNFGWGIHVSKHLTRNIQIKNCNVEVTHPNAQTSASDVFDGIVLSGASNSLYYYDDFVLDSIEIDSNNIRGGYAGIYQYSYFYNYYYTYGAPSETLKFRRNSISNVYNFGINTNGTSSLDISGNTVSMRKDASTTVYNYGIYISNHDATSSTNKALIVNNNRVWGVNYFGLYLNNVLVNANNRGQVYNNAISVGFNLANCYGMYIYNLTNTSLYHNSVLNNQAGTSNSSGAVYFQQGTSIRMRNNHFVCSNPFTLGTPAYISGVSYSSAAEFNHNNFFRPDTSGTFVYLNSWFTGRGFIGAGGNNINSRIINPSFISDTLLRTLNGCINGDTIALVSSDLLNATRNSPPDIGAYEVISVADDAGAIALVSPTNPSPAGTYDLTIRIINNGNNALNNANVGYRLNNGTPVIQAWSGALATCDTASVLFTGINQMTIAPGSLNTIKVFTNTPNNNPDNNTENDTTTVILATGLKGNYIVGAAPSDFLNLTAAASALSIRGVDSAVNFLIKTGTYNERFIVTSYAGAAASKPVTFRSLANHRDSVIIQSNNTNASDNYIVKLVGSRFVNFYRVTLNTQNTGFGYVVDVQPSSGFSEFRECNLLAPLTTTTSTNMSLVYGTNNIPGNISFVSNNLTGGSYAIYLRGTSTTSLMDNLIIDSNVISNQYYMGVYPYFTSNLKERGNTISTNSVYTVYYGIYNYYCDSAMEVSRNSIFSTTANGYGIATYYCDGTLNKPGSITNNTIRIGTGSTTANYGLRDQYSSYLLIANNTVAISSTTTTASYAGYFYYTSTISNTTRILNNIFSNLSTGGAVYHYNPTFGISDYNLIHTTGTANFVQRGTPAATYNSLAAFRAVVTTQEKNSLQYRPAFTSITNLNINVADTAAWAINGRGIQLPEVSSDIFGNPRSISVATGTPDLGAREITPTSLPPLCTAVPATPVAGGTQVFLFASDTVCKITHDAFASAPSTLAVRQYSGTNPPSVSPGDYHFNMYISTTVPVGSYSFGIDLYYKDAWLGSNPSETDTKLGFKMATNPWLGLTGAGSNVDSVRNILTGLFLNNYGLFTGTDNFLPLPIELTQFRGYAVENDAMLTWSTSSEINGSHFELERKNTRDEFETIAKIKAAGNSNVKLNYGHLDKEVFNNTNIAYYRLKMVDLDGSFEYSNIIRVGTNDEHVNIEAMPNPFKNSFTLKNIDANQTVEIIDIQGKLVYSQNVDKADDLKITLPSNLNTGIYFVRVSNNGSVQVIKLIKE
jgi:hypothetical protein